MNPAPNVHGASMSLQDVTVEVVMYAHEAVDKDA